MKKFLAIALALMLCLCSVVAFAEEQQQVSTDPTTWTAAETTANVTLKKIYNLAGSTNTALYPAEVLSFTSTPAQSNPTTQNLVIANLTVAGNTDQSISITMPAYTKVGVYEYTISEDAGNTQGVTYTTETIGVKVLVEYDYTNKKLVSSMVLTTSKGENEKENTFTNTYSVGTLSVQKIVAGTLASTSQYFTMTVTFTSANPVASAITVSGGSNSSNPTTVAASEFVKTTGSSVYSVTKTFCLKTGETLHFYNIPAGVTYAVNEDASHSVNDPNGSNPATGYTVAYDGNKSGTIAAGASALTVVTNTKNTTVTTGVSLDNAPYMIVLALVVVAGVVMMKKRSYNV